MVLDKLKSKFESKIEKAIGGTSIRPPPYPSLPASRREIFKYRLQVGTNIGGWFMLEKWLAPSLHSSNKSSDDSELAAVSASVKDIGLDRTRAKWDHHYDSFLNDEDWTWLAKAHVNAIRVPLGYYVLGAAFVRGTPFVEVAGVYENAWAKYKGMLELARTHNIGVLVDLHAVPGGANADSHSGVSGGGKFFSSSLHVSLALECIEYIAREVKDYDNVIGIQVVNEASYGAAAEKYYVHAAQKIREIDPTQIIVISDGWDRGKYAEFVKDKPGMLVDTHVYKCFSEADKCNAPNQLVAAAAMEWLDTTMIVGEFSCTLDTQTWNRVSKSDRAKFRAEYGRVQFNRFAQNSAGFYFWTFKFEQGSGGEWDYREMVNSGCIPIYERTKHKVTSNGEQESRLAVQAHAAYWDSQVKGEKMEHSRYQDGFLTGWRDAAQFWAEDESRIGQRTSWKNARVQQHVQKNGNSKYLWEFEQGFDTGTQALLQSVL
ncbi:glycoside hydrolase superfamily [Lipomyces orientalis]|uniref:Glycoside hydrolase superfamily n=1 Tax=Lipomyces orientalis TaxID=1233043 RepID=A0ACC3TZ47_9ASCO